MSKRMKWVEGAPFGNEITGESIKQSPVLMAMLEVEKLRKDLAELQAKHERLREAFDELAKLAHRGHLDCEDGWYSCPKCPEGSLQYGDPNLCTCGADRHNAEVERIIQNALDAEEKEEKE